MDEKAKQHLAARRLIQLPGFLYTSDNPTSNEDRILAQKVDDVFELSGMNNFLTHNLARLGNY